MKTYRTKFIDYDARREPGAKAREVHMVDGGTFALHPDDGSKYPSDDPGDMGMWLLGMKCARVLGLEWSVPEGHRADVPEAKCDDNGDAECTVCGRHYFSSTGPAIDIAVCPDCWTSGSCGPLGLV